MDAVDSIDQWEPIAICPVCSTPTDRFGAPRAEFKRRTAPAPLQSVFQCRHCRSIFRRPHLRAAEERERYARHNNDPADPAYRGYLRGIIETWVRPLLPPAAPPATILDYGCGPHPVLGMLLSAAGHRVVSYDRLFYPTPPVEPYAGRFDIVTCIEVIEHCLDPYALVADLALWLNDTGAIVLLTRLHAGGRDDFPGWWYQRDPTHISFFTAAALHHLACRAGLEVTPTPAGADPSHGAVLVRRR